ncbi:hypothetical protein AbraIFM66950_000143 [Aspergillus brasiliensis]|nr:hypothetical protein AbraIFM66950_000143 [Aspergillus brasiliensis]
MDHTIQRWLEWNNMQKALPEVMGILSSALRGLLATVTPPRGNDDEESDAEEFAHATQEMNEQVSIERAAARYL